MNTNSEYDLMATIPQPQESEPISAAQQCSRESGAGTRKRYSIWLRRLFWTMVVLFAVWQSIGFIIAYIFLYSDYHDPQPFKSPESHGLTFEEVRIPVEVEPGKKIELSSWFLPADEQADNFQGGAIILMLHGFGSAKGKVWTAPKINYAASLLDQGAESFVRNGFHVLMLDFRNFGGSDDYGSISLGLNETGDVRAAIAYIVDELAGGEYTIDPERIGIRAPSMGAATTVMALSSDPELPVQAVWLDSMFAEAGPAVTDFLTHFGFPRWVLPPTKFWLQQLSGADLAEVAPAKRIVSLPCPVMLVHSKDDTMIRVEHFYRLREATAAMPNVQTWLIDKHQHHRLWLNPEYHQRQLEFFRHNLARESIEQ